MGRKNPTLNLIIKEAWKSYCIFFITLRETEWVKAHENKELIFYSNSLTSVENVLP